MLKLSLIVMQHTIELLKHAKANLAVLNCVGQVLNTAEEIDMKRRKINNKLIHKMMRVLVLDEQEASMRLMVRTSGICRSGY